MLFWMSMVVFVFMSEKLQLKCSTSAKRRNATCSSACDADLESFRFRSRDPSDLNVERLGAESYELYISNCQV
jgi:hypothetical protein